MKKYNFRFVDDPKNQNLGLSDSEIYKIEEKVGAKFPKVYIQYLQKAGKKSNVFEVETEIEELKKIQNELRLELDKLNLLRNDKIVCIKKQAEYIEHFSSNFEKYYFFNLSEDKDVPELYYLEEFCINEGWLAFKKRVTRVKENNFVTFINEETGKKYGLGITQHLKNIPLYIISVPISIILLGVIAAQNLKEKILKK